MSQPPRILAFGGSLRKDSYNQTLAAVAAAAAREAGADVTLISLRDFPLPIFDADEEEASGLPENAKKLKQLFLDHDALIISSPEYNSSVTAALKNTLDWVSRSETDDEPALAAYRNKVALLFAASPGALGGLRGLVHLRAILGNIGVTVLPEQLAVGKAYEAFNDGGSLAHAGHAEKVKAMTTNLVTLLTKLKA